MHKCNDAIAPSFLFSSFIPKTLSHLLSFRFPFSLLPSQELVVFCSILSIFSWPLLRPTIVLFIHRCAKLAFSFASLLGEFIVVEEFLRRDSFLPKREIFVRSPFEFKVENLGCSILLCFLLTLCFVVFE